MPGGGTTGVALLSKLVRTKDLRQLQPDDSRAGSAKPKLTVRGEVCADRRLQSAAQKLHIGHASACYIREAKQSLLTFSVCVHIHFFCLSLKALHFMLLCPLCSSRCRCSVCSTNMIQPHQTKCSSLCTFRDQNRYHTAAHTAHYTAHQQTNKKQ